MLFRQRLIYLNLLILFTSPFPCLDIECGEPSYRDPPRSADCWHILAHLPLIHAPGAQHMASLHTNISDAIPFFPILNIVHGSCAIDADLYLVDASYGVRPRPSVTITRTFAFDAWTVIRQGIASIIQRCVDDEHETGTGTGFVNDTDWAYQIEVAGSGSDRQFDAQRVAMGWPQAGNQMAWRGSSLFRKTFYDM